jgi:hypothetical protein
MEAVAEAEDVTVRTLRNWKRLDPAEEVAPPGHPRLPEATRQEVRELVLGELERQGWAAGEETVWRGLGRCIRAEGAMYARLG